MFTLSLLLLYFRFLEGLASLCVYNKRQASIQVGISVVQALSNAASNSVKPAELPPRSLHSGNPPSPPLRGTPRKPLNEAPTSQGTNERGSNGSNLGISVEQDADSFFDEPDLQSHPISATRSQVCLPPILLPIPLHHLKSISSLLRSSLE